MSRQVAPVAERLERGLAESLVSAFWLRPDWGTGSSNLSDPGVTAFWTREPLRSASEPRSEDGAPRPVAYGRAPLTGNIVQFGSSVRKAPVVFYDDLRRVLERYLHGTGRVIRDVSIHEDYQREGWMFTWNEEGKPRCSLLLLYKDVDHLHARASNPSW